MKKSRNWTRKMTLEVAVHVDAKRTFTTVGLSAPDGMYGLGVAKRSSEDTYDSGIGFDIALARALRDLADNVEERS